MDRRQFLTGAAAGAAVLSVSDAVASGDEPPKAEPAKKPA